MSRRATAAEGKHYKGKGLPVEKMPIFCSPILYEPIFRQYGKRAKDMTVHFRYRHKGRECQLREVRSKRHGDHESMALFEFEDGSMLWLGPEEIHVEPGDGKVFGSHRYEMKRRPWL